MAKRDDSIKEDLLYKFSFLEGKIRIQRDRRVYAEVPQDKLDEVLKFAAEKLGFIYLCTMTGLDEGASLSFIYHLTAQDGSMLNLKISVPKDKPVIKTVTDRFKGAEIYEREVMDLLGAKVQGLPEGKRYPLPDDWPLDEYPLRKDWKKKL